MSNKERFLFRGHADTQTNVFCHENGNWILRYVDKLDQENRHGEQKVKQKILNFVELEGVSAEIVRKLKRSLEMLAVKTSANNVYVHWLTIKKLLMLAKREQLLNSEAVCLSQRLVMGCVNFLNKSQRIHLSSLSGYDLERLFVPDPKDYLGELNSNQDGQQMATVLSAEKGALTYTEVSDLLLGIVNAYRAGDVNLKEVCALFLWYETGVRNTALRLAKWRDFYLMEIDGKDVWFINLYSQKGAIEKSSYRVSLTCATFMLAYRQVFCEFSLENSGTDNIYDLPIFVRSGIVNSVSSKSASNRMFFKSVNPKSEVHWTDIFEAKLFHRMVQLAVARSGITTSRLGGETLTVNGHRFRHTGATIRAIEGLSLSSIQCFLRHKEPTTSRIYIDLVNKHLADQIDFALGPVLRDLFITAKKTKPRPLDLDPNKVVTFYDPNHEELVEVGDCAREAKCFLAPFSCVAECHKFERFDDVPIAAWEALLETAKLEKNSFAECSSDGQTFRYSQIVHGLERFVKEQRKLLNGPSGDLDG